MADRGQAARRESLVRADVGDLERHMLQAQSPTTAERSLQRSSSWCDAEARIVSSPDLRQQRLLREPGGFRRDFLHARAGEQGIGIADRPAAWRMRLIQAIASRGQVGGEAIFLVEASLYGLDPWDDDVWRAPAARRLSDPANRLSDIGVACAVFKANCGCSVLYMPRAWQHGGYVASAMTFILVGAVSTLCAVKLLQARAVAGKCDTLGTVRHLSYGDLMEEALGPLGRFMINVSILLQQSGTCCSYFIVNGTLLQSVFFKETRLELLILGQLALFVPLAAIRKVAALWPLNLLGSLLVIAGLAVALGEETRHIALAGPAGGLERANYEEFLVCLGTACFMFEGIGLVLPTYESSRSPENVATVYSIVMALMCMMVSAVGCLGYVAYGDDVATLILLNFPADALQSFIRLAFVMQVVCSFPLQLLPAARLMEGVFFAPMSNPPWARKCRKTGFRAIYVVFLSLVAIVGSTSLDNFVSLIGAVCGIPLAFVFPTVCHFALVAKGRPSQRLADLALIAIGAMLAIAVTAVNMINWLKMVSG